MKNYLTSKPIRTVVYGVAGLATMLTTVRADEPEAPAPNKWNVSFSGNVLFNMSAKFKGQLVAPAAGSGSSVHPGAQNYDNGYVGRDISDDPNLSSYWGYSDASQQILSGSDVVGLNFERTTVATMPSGSSKDADASFGGEVLLRRELLQRDKYRAGLELGFSYNPVSVHQGYNFTADGQRTSYTYNMVAPIDSTFFPPPGYEGPFNGIGPLINPTEIVGATTILPNAVAVTGSRSIDADIFGFRFGPYFELPLSRKFSAAVSAGVMLAVISDDVKWTQTLTTSASTTTASVSESSSGLIAGGYVGLDANYRLSERWSVVAGARFQGLGTYEHSVGAGKMQLDLGSAFSVNLGIGWNF